MAGQQGERAGMQPPPVGELTHTSRFTLQYLPVAPELASHITTFYHFCCEDTDIREIQPASVGHLAIFPRGEGAIHFRDGRSDPTHETVVLTPMSVAAPFTVAGPFHAIGAALTPLGWAELTGQHAASLGNRLLRASDVLDASIALRGAAWCAAYRAGGMSAADCAQAMGDWMAAHFKPIADGHRQLIASTTQWLASALDPAIDDLYVASPYSLRQTQRLVERYFGLAPTALRRKYRALRAAAALSHPGLGDAEEAMIREAFYDQPHLIREIRLFAGRTPARLTDEPDSYLTEMLDLRNLRELDPRQ